MSFPSQNNAENCGRGSTVPPLRRCSATPTVLSLPHPPSPSRGARILKRDSTGGSSRGNRDERGNLGKYGAGILRARAECPNTSLIQTTPTTVQESDATSEPAHRRRRKGKAPRGAARKRGHSRSRFRSRLGRLRRKRSKGCRLLSEMPRPLRKAGGKRTKDYVTEWDEAANPHVLCAARLEVDRGVLRVPRSPSHSLQPTEDQRTPNVKYCYSCHHGETLVKCTECHKD